MRSRFVVVVGLPPRGRGRVRLLGLICGHRRITPAWAGKRHYLLPTLGAPENYPRVGGEETLSPSIPRYRAGLPPRGRGRALGCALAGFASRITPAWAGKSAKWKWCATTSRDYPRVGGEEGCDFASS